MAASRLPTCCHCGRRFRPCAYNRHHQKYCSLPECRRERDRLRRRRYYEKHRKDASFRASERERCREGMHRSRLKEKIREAPVIPPSGDVLTGLISQFVGSSDPVVVNQAAAGYADRGRRLAVPPVLPATAPR